MSRITSEFIVATVENDTELKIVARGLENSNDARRWIKRNGEDGVTYQIATLKGVAIEVEVKTIKKRNLFEHAEKE